MLFIACQSEVIALLISRTPLRVSLFGGGTDYPIWYRDNGGQVINFTINKYNYITLRALPPFFEYNYRIRYHINENKLDVSSIEHPVVREALLAHELDLPLELLHTADLPARSGLGSSSSFTVGLIYALHSLKNFPRSKYQLALEAIQLEQNVLKENVGSQDQIAAAYGGLNHISFGGSEEFRVNPIKISVNSIQRLESWLLLYHTGLVRTASEIAFEQIRISKSKRRELEAIGDICGQAIQEFYANEICVTRIGKLLDEQWKIKRTLTPLISNSEIDLMYTTALNAGAIGGKLLGAGNGGFMLLVAAPEAHKKIREALTKLLTVPFKIESSGAKIIYNNTDDSVLD
jgi:D-glycero-alpha-D-manno-heptose-7-phosphate kinase